MLFHPILVAMRCPTCSALNPDDAQWCGQCMKRFTSAAPPPPPPPLMHPNPSAGSGNPRDAGGAGIGVAPRPGLEAGAGAAVVAAAAGVGTVVGPGGPPRSAVGLERGAFKVTEAGVLWRCTSCDSENPLDAGTCGVCGQALAATLRPPAPERPARDPGTTTMISLFFPGAGHGYLGMWGQAVARAAISVWVVLTALIGAIQGATLLAVVFGVAATGLWLLAAHDSYREALGEPNAVILKGKLFLYLVLGLLVLLFILLFTAALSTR